MFRLILTAVSVCCSLSGGVGQEEKTADEYDYLDESNEAGAGAVGRGPGAVDRACLACRRCCGPCCSCSTRFQLALLSSLGFCISFGIRCNMGVAVLQMTSNVTQRYAVSPLLPGANVTIELVRSLLALLSLSFPTQLHCAPHGLSCHCRH